MVVDLGEREEVVNGVSWWGVFGVVGRDLFFGLAGSCSWLLGVSPLRNFIKLCIHLMCLYIKCKLKQTSSLKNNDESKKKKKRNWASLVAQMVKSLPPAMRETWFWFLGWEDPLEKGMATYSSILAWRITWTEEPGRLQSTGSQRVRYNWVIFTFTIPHLFFY